MSSIPSFVRELKRRRVIRVALVYAVAALAVIEAADLIVPRLGIPDWAVTFVMVLAILGLPFTVALAWAFQLTPDGVRRDDPAADAADPGTSGSAKHRPAGLGANGRIAVAGAVAVLALAGGAFVVFNGDAPARSVLPMDRVVVLPFDNLTGVDSLDAIGHWAADWITQEMTGHGIARVVPTRVAVSAAVAAASTGLAGGELLAMVAAEAGAGVVITGSVYREGDRLSYHATINDANTGDVLRTVVVTAPIDRPSDGFVELRRRVGGVLGALLDSDFAEFTRAMTQPPSLEAYQEYVRGRNLFGQSRFDDAVQPFEAAVALDSAYSMPFVYLAYSHWNAGRPDSAVAIAERARHRKLPPFESAWLDYFFGFAYGDPELELESALRMRRIAPGSRGDYDTGRVLFSRGEYRAAVDSLAVLNPTTRELRDWVPYWAVLTGSYHMLGDHRAELDAARRGREIVGDRRELRMFEARALVGLGRIDEAMEVLDAAMRVRGDRGVDPGMVAWYTARELHAHGRPDMARAAFERALGWIETLPADDRLSFTARLRKAAVFFYMGRYHEADSILVDLTARDPGHRTARLYGGLVAAALGRTEEAERALAELRDHDSTPYVHGDHFRDAAQIAAQLGRVDQAIDLLEQGFREALRHGIWLHDDPVFDPLRRDPRFRRIADPNG
jgi:tetratricopeptide (TPR) repeat protein/TolB-like protein